MLDMSFQYSLCISMFHRFSFTFRVLVFHLVLLSCCNSCSRSVLSFSLVCLLICQFILLCCVMHSFRTCIASVRCTLGCSGDFIFLQNVHGSGACVLINCDNRVSECVLF